jgi:hypothetical protein
VCVLTVDPMEGIYSRDQYSDYLKSFDMFRHDPEEGSRYVSDSIERFILTLDQIPQLSGA